MHPEDKRDYREETALNAAEYQSLRILAGRLGLTKAATLRLALHQLCEQITRVDLLAETGVDTGKHRD